MRGTILLNKNLSQLLVIYMYLKAQRDASNGQLVAMVTQQCSLIGDNMTCEIRCYTLLQGAYVNIDEFNSKFHVLCNQLGHQDYPVKRVFNHQST